MRHVHDGDAQIVAERLDQGQDFELALGVERGEGLIHQQNLGRGEQRPAHGHALLFAAGKARRLALEQMPDPQRLDHLGKRNACCSLRRKPASEQKILPDAEMREELGILEHEPNPAPIGRHENVSFGIHQDAAIEHDGAAIRPLEASDQIDGHRLARA